eukprot:5865278-Pleurochrysis_carterae.AAC.6
MGSATPSRLSVPHTAATAATAKRLLEQRPATPVVLDGLLTDWPPLSWDLNLFQSKEFDNAEACIRLHPRTGTAVWEGECTYVRAPLADFCRWLVDDECTSDLAKFSRRDHVKCCPHGILLRTPGDFFAQPCS